MFLGRERWGKTVLKKCIIYLYICIYLYTYYIYIYILVGGFNPSEKYVRQIGHLSQIGVIIKTI